MVHTGIDVFDGLLSNFTPQTERQIEEWEARQRVNELRQFHENSGMDKAFYLAKVSDLEGETSRRVEAFIKHYEEGMGLFLVVLGGVGTGKTHIACSVMNELQSGTYLDMPELHLKLNTADRYNATETREQLMHRLSKCKLLVLDEVGRMPNRKEQEQETLFYLMNKRYANGRATIIVSNMSLKEFNEFAGQAIIDRMKGRSIFLELTGESRRGKNGNR